MINGIINVYKEAGFTSHDVVAKLRGILRQKKIGHTGTLDPQAKGVLPVCLGKATKVSDLLTNKSKTYEVVGLLGVVTDTQDIYGETLETKEVNVGKSMLIEAIQSFVGEYEQLPPMYSAIKINGKKLYDYAREGKEVPRKTRKVVIYSIEIKDIDLTNNTFKLTVDCSKGTYIRTLINDIGQILGCGACMKELLRTRVGEFDLEASYTLDEIETSFKEGIIDSALIKIEKLFPEYEEIIVFEEYSKIIYNGNYILPNHIIDFDFNKNYDKVKVYDWKKKFIAIYQYNEAKKTFKPFKMFI